MTSNDKCYSCFLCNVCLQVCLIRFGRVRLGQNEGKAPDRFSVTDESSDLDHDNDKAHPRKTSRRPHSERSTASLYQKQLD